MKKMHFKIVKQNKTQCSQIIINVFIVLLFVAFSYDELLAICVSTSLS